MVERIGQCLYCGQGQQVRVPENATPEEINQEASNLCNCDIARAQQKIQTNINVTEQYIKDELHAPKEVEELLMTAVPYVGRGDVDKIKIYRKQADYTMNTTAKGAIKIEKKTTLKEVKES